MSLFKNECNLTIKSFQYESENNISSDNGLYTLEIFEELNANITKKLNITVLEIKIDKTRITLYVLGGILVILLLAAGSFAIYQKSINDSIKKKHKELIRLLNVDGQDVDPATMVGNFLNLQIDNLNKLCFKKKWEIDPENIRIDKTLSLGSGEFGDVWVAYILRMKQAENFNQKNSILLSKKYKESKHIHETFKLLTIKNDEKKNAEKVAAKEAKDYAKDENNVEALFHELKILGYLHDGTSHLNILRLVGSFTSQVVGKNIAYIFCEYCDNGDLKKWLSKNTLRYSKDHRDHSLIIQHRKQFSQESCQAVAQLIDLFDSENFNSDELNWYKFNDSDLIFFCYQIAKGMKYLADKRILHRDLAARNILLTKNYECKISDFGLADESVENAAFFKGNKKVPDKIPARWTAPERFQNNRYEANSDVWSFGVLIYEIFELGQKNPYPNIKNNEFQQFMIKIFNGSKRLARPTYGFNEICDIMYECLTVDFKKRPSFDKVLPKIENLLGEDHYEYYDLLSKADFKRQVQIQATKAEISRMPSNFGHLVPLLNGAINQNEKDRRVNHIKDKDYHYAKTPLNDSDII